MPETHGIQQVLSRFDGDLAERLDHWRAEQRPIPPRSRAVCRLVELALNEIVGQRQTIPAS